MNTLFFLIRLPFFVAGIGLLAVIGFWFIGVGIGLGIMIAMTLVPLWLAILLPGSIVAAAFSNDPQVVSRFLRWTWHECILEAAEWIRENSSDYFQTYNFLAKWLVGGIKGLESEPP